MNSVAFLPQTLGAWAAIAAAVFGGIAGILGIINRRTVQEIKVNVNHRLDVALDEISSLRQELGTAKASPAEKPLEEK